MDLVEITAEKIIGSGEIKVGVYTNAIASEWVEKECKAFMEYGKIVIPFVVDAGSRDILPTYLSRLQFIDGTEKGGLWELSKQLRMSLGI